MSDLPDTLTYGVILFIEQIFVQAYRILQKILPAKGVGNMLGLLLKSLTKYMLHFIVFELVYYFILEFVIAIALMKT